jgi:hypothetical protein
MNNSVAFWTEILEVVSTHLLGHNAFCWESHSPEDLNRQQRHYQKFKYCKFKVLIYRYTTLQTGQYVIVLDGCGPVLVAGLSLNIR